MAHLFGELDILDAGRDKDGKGKRGDGKVRADLALSIPPQPTPDEIGRCCRVLSAAE